MNEKQALNLFRQFIDQALGLGYYKNVEAVMTSMKALDILSAAVAEKERLQAQAKATTS